MTKTIARSDLKSQEVHMPTVYSDEVISSNHASINYEFETTQTDGEVTPEARSRLKILICDDDPGFRKLIRVYLRYATRDVELVEAGNRVDIQGALDKSKFDLILLDILMPEKSGMEWLKEMVERHIAPVVMLTGSGNEEIAVQSIHEGAIDYISKDKLTKDKLFSAIELTLELWKIKQMEAEIKKEKDFSEKLIETAGAVIVGIDRDGNVILCNTKTVEVTGYCKEELIGKNWLNLVYHDAVQRKALSERINSCLHGTPLKAYDTVITRNDGDTRTLSCNATLLKEADGEISGILFIAQDITERKQLEQELKENKNYLESLILESPTAILSTNLKGNIVVVNKSVEYLLGYKRDELVGKPLSLLISGQRDLEMVDIKNVSLEFVKSDGSIIPLNVSTSVQQYKGKTCGLIVTLKDLSELRGLFITPVSEVEAETEPEYPLEPGSMFIVEEEKPEKSFELFVDSVKHGRPGLYITRQNPLLIRGRYHLEKTPNIWLTRSKVPEENCITPDELVKLYKTIENFIREAEDGIILFEGMEYLIMQNGFPPVIKFMQSLNDVIMVHLSRLILVIDPLTLDDKELHVLRREMQSVPSISKLPECL